MEAQGERLLQDLLAQEKKLVSKVEEAHAEKRGVVCVKRKLGAVRRLERRIAAGNTQLSETLNKAKSALERAKEVA